MDSMKYLILIFILASAHNASPDEVVSTINPVTTTTSAPNVSLTSPKSAPLKILGIEVPDLPGINLSAPALSPLPCVSPISFRLGKCNPDPNCGGAALPDGPCALSIGTCCTDFITCGGSVLGNVSLLSSPGYPAPIAKKDLCEITIGKNLLAKQIRIDFLDFELTPLDPATGLCSDDSLEILGNPALSLPRICGSATGQHLYIPLDLTILSIKLKFTISDKSFNRRFKIQVTQFEANHWNSAPPGCLQFHSHPSGSVSSLTFEKTKTTRLVYAVCFKRFNDVCGINLSVGNKRLARSVEPRMHGQTYGYAFIPAKVTSGHAAYLRSASPVQAKSDLASKVHFAGSKSYKSLPLIQHPGYKTYVPPLAPPAALPIPTYYYQVPQVPPKEVVVKDLLEDKLKSVKGLVDDKLHGVKGLLEGKLEKSVPYGQGVKGQVEDKVLGLKGLVDDKLLGVKGLLEEKVLEKSVPYGQGVKAQVEDKVLGLKGLVDDKLLGVKGILEEKVLEKSLPYGQGVKVNVEDKLQGVKGLVEGKLQGVKGLLEEKVLEKQLPYGQYARVPSKKLPEFVVPEKKLPFHPIAAPSYQYGYKPLVEKKLDGPTIAYQYGKVLPPKKEEKELVIKDLVEKKILELQVLLAEINKLAGLDLTNLLNLTKFQIPQFEVPKVELPKLDIPKFEIPKLDIPKLPLPVEVPVLHKPFIPGYDVKTIVSESKLVPKLEIPKLDIPKIDLKPTLVTLPPFTLPSLPPLELPKIPEPVPIIPVATSLKGVDLSAATVCAGKSTITAPPHIMCEGNFKEEILLATSPLIVWVDDRSGDAPLEFALSYSRKSC